MSKLKKIFFNPIFLTQICSPKIIFNLNVKVYVAKRNLRFDTAEYFTLVKSRIKKTNWLHLFRTNFIFKMKNPSADTYF